MTLSLEQISARMRQGEDIPHYNIPRPGDAVTAGDEWGRLYRKYSFKGRRSWHRQKRVTAFMTG